MPVGVDRTFDVKKYLKNHKTNPVGLSMRIAKVIGTVTLNSRHPSLWGARFKVVVPLTLDNLTGRGDKSSEELTAYDEIGADVGCLVAISEGREAAMPFHPDVKPLDAYIAAILDSVRIESPMDATATRK